MKLSVTLPSVRLQYGLLCAKTCAALGIQSGLHAEAQIRLQFSVAPAQCLATDSSEYASANAAVHPRRNRAAET